MKQARSGQQTAFPTIPIARQIFQALALVAGCVMIITGLGMLFSPPDALAFGVGGAISLLPNAYFAMRVLLVPAPLDARLRLRQLYAAEVTKLLICALLFALVFTTWKALSPGWLMIGFVVTHVGYLILSLRLVNSAGRRMK